MKPFYLTTSIAYPNADPHLGHALELVQADFLARYYRLRGKKVKFLTGLDEHGLKVQRAAEASRLSVEQFLEEKTTVFKNLTSRLLISYDRFLRTTEPDHIQTAQAVWKMCAERGDIYKKKYQAWYNLKEEEHLGMVEDIPDPQTLGIDHQFIEKIDEENYFFALSRYRDQIMEILTTRRYKVTPASRLQEIINFVEERGLQDISISRQASKLSWGIPVPDDDSQVMYVWFDALTNYLTAASDIDGQGKVVPNQFWPADLHIVGKDIIRFHSLIWTGMLLSVDLELPAELLVHGFVTSDGRKMSKSIGNVVDPLKVIESYGVETLRWYLLKEIPTTGDADFTEERIKQLFLADLANDLGNLVSRVWAIAQKYYQGKVPPVSQEQVDNLEKVLVEENWRKYHQAVEERQIDEALQAAHQLVVFCNRRIDEMKPWEMAKDSGSKDSLDELLYELLEIIRHLSVMIQPALPLTSQKIQERLFGEINPDSWKQFETSQGWGLLQPGSQLGDEQLILFPKRPG